MQDLMRCVFTTSKKKVSAFYLLLVLVETQSPVSKTWLDSPYTLFTERFILLCWMAIRQSNDGKHQPVINNSNTISEYLMIQNILNLQLTEEIIDWTIDYDIGLYWILLIFMFIAFLCISKMLIKVFLKPIKLIFI